MQGGSLQVDADRLGAKSGGLQPSGAHRRKALCLPALFPRFEMTAELLQHRCRHDLAIAFLRDRCGWKRRTLGRSRQGYPDTHNKKTPANSRGPLRLEQNPGDLTTVYQHIVRPFVCEPPELR